MAVMETEQIEKKLQKKLNPRRYRHTMGVRYTSICLAMRYGEDLEKASLAGLLHDCAKYMKPEKLLRKCRENAISVTEAEERAPYLLHGKVGSVYARTKYGVEDEDILNAITWHTTGRPGMSLLEKIVFTADYIEPGRNQAPHLDKLRQEAFIDLDSAVLHILEQTLDYLQTTGADIDPMTENTCKYYRCLKDRKNA